MPRNKRCPNTPDIFDAIQEPLREYEQEKVKSATIKGKWALAISNTLKDSGLARDEIAEQMSIYLGENVPVNMLDAYSSQGRDTHLINLPRLEALIHVTKDERLINLLAETIGYMVNPKCYSPYLQYAYHKELAKKANQKVAELEAKLND